MNENSSLNWLSSLKWMHTCPLPQVLLSLRLCDCEQTPTSTRPAAPPVTSALVASAEANPTTAPMTTARSRCFPGTRPAPPVTAALVASTEANPTGTRRRHLHPCRLRQAKSHRRAGDPSSSSLLSWSQIPPAHGRLRLVIAAPLWTNSHRRAASSTSRHLGAGWRTSWGHPCPGGIWLGGGGKNGGGGGVRRWDLLLRILLTGEFACIRGASGNTEVNALNSGGKQLSAGNAKCSSAKLD